MTHTDAAQPMPPTAEDAMDASVTQYAAAVEQGVRNAEMTQFITPEGRRNSELDPARLPDPATQLWLYRHMLRIRHFDERAWVLYRQGKMGVFPPYGGMEASQAGSSAALTSDDWLFPTYRDTGAALTYGLPIAQTIAYWRSSPHGWYMPEDLKITPFYIPIATQYPQAVGAALAEKRQGTNNVAMAFIGDGGSSEGDFHEGLNFAGALNAPVVFILQNNGWAISVPTKTQTKAQNLSRRAEGYGIPGVRVDGNDILAVYTTTKEAVARARDGQGPTLIENVTYRMKPHTVADDPTRYRTEDMLAGWDEKDPIQRLRTYLLAQGTLTEAAEAKMLEEISAEFKAGVEAADALPDPSPAEIVDHVFAEATPQLREQRKQIMEENSMEEYAK